MKFAPPSSRGFFRDGLEGQEIVLKADGVRVQQLLNAFAAVRAKHEAGVMIFVHAIGDFGIAVRICVGMFLPREAEYDAGVIFSCRRQRVTCLPCSDFESRPFPPEVDAARSLDDIGDVRAADARRDFQKIKFAVGVGFQEFAVCDTADAAESFDDLSIGGEQFLCVFGIVRQRARREDAALM